MPLLSCMLQQSCWSFVARRRQDQSYIKWAYQPRDSEARVVCSGCCSVHRISLFSSLELQKDSSIRQCLGREGRLCLCPHTVMSYDEVQDWFFDQRFRLEHCCADDRHGVLLIPLGAMIIRQLFGVDENKVAGPNSPPIRAAEILHVLQNSDVPICPHKRLSDPAVMRNISSLCKTPKDCECKQCTSTGTPTCETCNTRVIFKYVTMCRSNPISFQKEFAFLIDRDLSLHKGPTEPQWISQLMYLNDFPKQKSEEAKSVFKWPFGWSGTKRVDSTPLDKWLAESVSETSLSSE